MIKDIKWVNNVFMTELTNQIISLANNPLDIVEKIAKVNSLTFERNDDFNANLFLASQWCDFRLNFFWQMELDIVHFFCPMEVLS